MRQCGLLASLVLANGVVGLSLSSQAEENLADSARDLAASVADQEGTEHSVLIATRKADARQEETASETSPHGGGLKPISASSDKEPVLAAPEPTLAPALDTPTRLRSIKMASNTTTVEPAKSEPLAKANSHQQLAVFHGIQPGVSTKKQLLEAWGKPQEVSPTEGGELFAYELESFRSVNVLVENETVELMEVRLRQPVAPDVLAKKIQADPAEAAQVIEPETGELLAYAYPEQGIVLVLDRSDEVTPDSSPLVSQMLLQPRDAQTFFLRAEQRPRRSCSARIADLREAVSIDPSEAHAHWLLAEALLQTGQAAPAEVAASRAVDLDPENIAYRQRWGETLSAIGKYDAAVLATREVLDEKTAPKLVRAKALHQMGLLAALGDANIAKKTVGFHAMAIEEADALATSDDRKLRCEAKRLLVEAHLAVALDVSRRDYTDKMGNVAQWVSRASGFAEELIANDEGELDLRIRVAQQSLTALSNFKPANDPEPLIQEILDTLQEIETESNDPLWIEQLEWATGVAYLRAVQIEHHRRNADQALQYSEQAIELLGDKAEKRRDNPMTEKLIGQLYFHIGALHAVHQKQHAEAVDWYDRAFPLLATDAPDSQFTVPRREGEALVSMAVSYWSEGDKERAISLTEMGAELIEKAVAGGVVEESTLAVPYGNLAVMHKKLGNMGDSARYAKLAESMRETEPERPEAKATPVKQAGVAAKPMPKKSAKPNQNTTNKKPTRRASRSSTQHR